MAFEKNIDITIVDVKPIKKYINTYDISSIIWGNTYFANGKLVSNEREIKKNLNDGRN